MLFSPLMASAVSANHRADRAALIQKVALVRQVRRLADELESLSCQFEKTGALSAIRRFMELHAEGNPDFDMLDAAKNLRSYAGILSIIGRTSSKPEIATEKETRPRPPGTLPRKREQQGNRVTLSF